MVQEVLADLPPIFGAFGIVLYLLSIVGLAIMLYAIAVLTLVVLSLFRMEGITVLKALHVISIVEVYAFICIIIGMILAFKIYGLLIFKLLLFGVIVVFNGITATRLIAKTAYFYKKSK